MRLLIVLSLAFVLLLGCTGNQSGSNTSVYEANNSMNQTSPQPPPTTQPTTQPTQPQVNTTNMTQNVTPPSNNTVLTADYVPPKLPTYNFSNTTTSDGRLIVYFFFSPRCEACVVLRPDITRLEAAYTNVDWREYDITTQNGTIAYVEFANEHNLSVKQRLVPQVLVNGTIITDRFQINASLGGILQNFTITSPSPSRESSS